MRTIGGLGWGARRTFFFGLASAVVLTGCFETLRLARPTEPTTVHVARTQPSTSRSSTTPAVRTSTTLLRSGVRGRRTGAVEAPGATCEVTETVGYRQGKPVPLSLVRIGHDEVERRTASAYWAMRQAAAADGVHLAIRSGFRTAEAQEWLYQCYRTCSCNGCTKAARPGYSNHQSGRALDLDLSSPDVHPWLVDNAARFGFRETVRGEPWHWEFSGRSRAPDICAAETGAIASGQIAVRR